MGGDDDKDSREITNRDLYLSIETMRLEFGNKLERVSDKWDISAALSARTARQDGCSR
ncbi:MAG: hypothetical protein SA339_05755 [Methanomassiliicoccus sp.]|nr:hypothetical protein [Methanomassiliicoccus sp.]